MSTDLRPITRDEFEAFHSVASTTFGNTPSPEGRDHAKSVFEFERSLGAFDNGRIVATSGVVSFEMTLPGLTRVPAAGVTWITVAPTHRRRGILTSIMERQLDDFARRGEPIGILLASESIIYGRYGYGMATQQISLETDTHYRQLGRHPEMRGSVEGMEAEDVREFVPDIYNRMRLAQTGAINRSDALWEIIFRDPESWRGGATHRMYALYRSAAGTWDGYAGYRIKMEWEHGFPKGRVIVGDFITITPEARVALLQFLLSIDLIRTVSIENAPVDDPLRFMMADPRRLRVSSYGDWLWLRVVDVVGALQARRYNVEGQLVLEIDDPFRPRGSGRYLLEGGPEGAACKRTRSKPDLSLQIADLGAVYLGGMTFGTLARAGRVVERVPGALRRADLMFGSDPLPWCATEF